MLCYFFYHIEYLENASHFGIKYPLISTQNKFLFLLFFTDMAFPNYRYSGTTFFKLKTIIPELKMSFSRFRFNNSSLLIYNYKLSRRNRVKCSLYRFISFDWLNTKANRDLLSKLFGIIYYKSIINPCQVKLWMAIGLRIFVFCI